MLTLTQLEKLLEQGNELKAELEAVDRRLAKFNAIAGDTVPCRAYADVLHNDNYGRGASYYVEVMPVAKSVVISALQRERSKVVQQLRELGIEVNESEVQRT